MSQYYAAGDVVFWNPSNGVSRLFLGQVRLFEDGLGQASGFGPMVSDECQIDLRLMDEFAKALVADPTLRQNTVWRALAEGTVVMVLALAHRAGQLSSLPPPIDALDAELRDRAQAVARSLPA